MKPTLPMYILRTQHGICLFILSLKMLTEVSLFSVFKKTSHNFGANNETLFSTRENCSVFFALSPL